VSPWQTAALDFSSPDCWPARALRTVNAASAATRIRAAAASVMASDFFMVGSLRAVDEAIDGRSGPADAHR
jgi:hypothetical protein